MPDLQGACLAQDIDALKRLRAGISVTMADASAKKGQEYAMVGVRTADACLQSLRGESRVYLVSNGGLSAWRRKRHGLDVRRRVLKDVSNSVEKGRRVEGGSAVRSGEGWAASVFCRSVIIVAFYIFLVCICLACVWSRTIFISEVYQV